MASSSWETIPTHTAVVEVLKRRGAIADKALYKEIRRLYKDLSWREFIRTLMKLEIQGLIHVYATGRNRTMIELIRRD
ncbi:TPA: hypothetical protein EYP44_03940 [Candidatus Bathyarchaeota archaeon]|nr:hypothetical protein [Candidatus Bathyarchaeota archaeon]